MLTDTAKLRKFSHMYDPTDMPHKLKSLQEEIKLQYFDYIYFQMVGLSDIKISPCINSSHFYLYHGDGDMKSHTARGIGNQSWTRGQN